MHKVYPPPKKCDKVQNQAAVSTSVKMVFFKTFIFILYSVNKSNPGFGTPHTETPAFFACFYKHTHKQLCGSLSIPADYVEIAGLISLSAFLTESSPCLDYGKLL